MGSLGEGSARRGLGQDKRTDGRRRIFFNNYNKKPTSTDAKHDGIVPYTIESTGMHDISISDSSYHNRNNPKSYIGRARLSRSRALFRSKFLGFAARQTPNLAQKVNAKERPNTILSSTRWHQFGVQFVQT
jgi:hypothetical protein